MDCVLRRPGSGVVYFRMAMRRLFLQLAAYDTVAQMASTVFKWFMLQVRAALDICVIDDDKCV